MLRELETGSEEKAATGQVSVTRLALETGVEFAGAARYLNETGRLSGTDGRMSPTALDTNASVATSRRAFLAEAAHYHEEISEKSCQSCSPVRPLKGIVGLQKRLIGAIRTSGDHSGLEAASLAMTFEEAGTLLQDQGGDRRLGRRLFEIAARTTDRVTLTDRCRGFDGLLCDVACSNQRSMREVAGDLNRLRVLPKGDPRLDIPADEARILHRHHNEELLSHVKASLFSRIGELGPTRDPAFSRAQVVEDIARIPGREAKPSSGIDRDRRDRDFMGTIARIGERVAMNMHENGKDRASVASVLATSEAATMRAAVYGQRVRSAERELAGSDRSARRDDDAIMM